MHYLDEGPRDAPPVLMLHGNPTWSFYYRNLVLALRDRYRCIAPDHIGCGLSDKPAEADYPYRLENRIADLEALYQHLDLDRPLNLVVHDWGGAIGFGWAMQYGHAIGRRVIMNTAAFPMPAGKRFPLALWFAGRTAPGGWLVRRCNAFSGLAARLAFRQPVSPEVRAAYTGPYDSWDNRIATLRFVQDIPLGPGDSGYDILARTGQWLSEFDGQTALIAWGEKDFVFDRRVLREWQRLLPAARVIRYPQCGHYLLEDGGAPLIDEISSFLDQGLQAAA
jgi:haloalkane dehalogenase